MGSVEAAGGQPVGQVPTQPRTQSGQENCHRVCTGWGHLVWRHTTAFPLLKPERVMVITMVTMLVTQREL